MKFQEECRLLSNKEVVLCFNGEFYHGKVVENPNIRAIGKTIDEVLNRLLSLMKLQNVA